MKGNSTSEKVFDTTNVIFLILFAFVTLYPFWYVFIISFTNVSKVPMSEVNFWPRLPTLDSYRVVFSDNSLISGYMISSGRVIFGVALCLLTNSTIAYALSRKKFLLRKWLNYLAIIPMFISGGLIPFFLVVHSLHLVNTFMALVIPFGFDPFGILLFKGYFLTVPDSLEESAKMDGANDIQVFFRIYLPLSMPILATMSLFWAVFFWNDFIWANFLIFDNSLQPIQAILYNIMFNMSNVSALDRMSQKHAALGANLESVKAATIILTTVPILFVYPFVQKYFVKGIVLGAVKE